MIYFSDFGLRKALCMSFGLMFCLASCDDVSQSQVMIAQTDSLLVQVHHDDQQVRKDLMDLQQRFIASPQMHLADSIVMLVSQMQHKDSINRRVVDSLLRDDWPEGLSEESNQTIWLVIDHADVEYQECYLPMIERQVALGCISQSDYATLTDRVNVARKRPQLYGTQTGYSQNGADVKTYVYPVKDVMALDSLRVSVGLDSMHLYLQKVSEALGSQVRLDTTLTWDILERELQDKL